MAKRTFAMAFGAGLLVVACGGSDEGGGLFGNAGQAGASGDSGSGGTGTGGTGTGGTGTGGTGTGGTATGGSAGAASGGSAGAASGGSAGAASGGSAGSGTGGSATGGSAGAGTGGTGTGGSAGSGTGGSGGGCMLVTWCKDADADEYGDPATEVDACSSPGAGYVKKSSKPRACEDCNDANKLVHPNSTHCDGAGYPVGGGKVSFDFNCDDKELACHDFKKAAANGCTLDTTGGSVGCSGSGYLKTGRTGSGVDPYCGSDQWLNCQVSGDPGSLICSSSVVLYNPVTCK